MDLRLSPEERELQLRVRAWLADHVPKGEPAPASTAAGVAVRRAWERELFEAGFAAVDWPTQHGGLGLDPIGTAIFYGEYVAAGAPERLNRIGLGLCGPVLIEWGTPAQQERWLTNILTSDELWCQGFSEPGAGSDLASLSTRGEVGAEGILVNGQKVWTSHSRFASWMFALVRTDPAAERHQGLSLVVIDMSDTGVDVRPIPQMNGGADFSEVFLTDVIVPHENVIGPANSGWSVAMTTLRHERGSGLNTADHFAQMLLEVVQLIPEERLDDGRVVEAVGRLVEQIEAYRYLSLRTLSQGVLGRPLGPQSYMGKLWWSEMQTRIFEFGLEQLGERALLADSADDVVPRLRARYWLSRAAHIYAGANEIQRDVIAERALGLPKGRG